MCKVADTGFVVMCDRALPGERFIGRVTRRKGNYAEVRVVGSVWFLRKFWNGVGKWNLGFCLYDVFGVRMGKCQLSGAYRLWECVSSVSCVALTSHLILKWICDVVFIYLLILLRS